MRKSMDLSGDRRRVVEAGQRETLKDVSGEMCPACSRDPSLAATDGLHAENGTVQSSGSCGEQVEPGDQLGGSVVISARER